MMAADWLTSDAVTEALARIRREGEEGRVPIGKWLDRNDPFFSHPTKALDAGYSLAELAGEYERVFLTRELAAYQMAEDLRQWCLSQPRRGGGCSY